MTEDELILHFFQLDGNLIISVAATFCLLRERHSGKIFSISHAHTKTAFVEVM